MGLPVLSQLSVSKVFSLLDPSLPPVPGPPSIAMSWVFIFACTGPLFKYMFDIYRHIWTLAGLGSPLEFNTNGDNTCRANIPLQPSAKPRAETKILLTSTLPSVLQSPIRAPNSVTKQDK